MLFNSIEFAIFLPIVFILFWFVFKKRKNQNILLVIASYFFYGWWDWRFLILIFFSSLIDFYVGKNLEKTRSSRFIFLSISLIANLGLLGFFKYYNFFIDNFVGAFTFFGSTLDVTRLKIILPVGISFYTFQTLSYTIDVYRREIKPTKDFVAFFAYVSFFPQLVAGPIERATHLLHQFYKEKSFSYSYATSGIQLIIWGAFKKIVIADNLAIIVDGIFSDYSNQSAGSLILGAVMFAFQIYGDFSGYSDIAIGTARFFGFDLRTNFKFPYLSENVGQFWKRWHISLSSWFRDYLYIPLGGSKGSLIKAVRNVFIVFLVSGFWHGANWTFIVWGLIHAVLYIPLFVFTRINKKQKTTKKLYITILNVLFTFTITTLAWIFFRSDTISDAILYIDRIISNKSGTNFYLSTTKYKIITLFSCMSILFLMIIELYNMQKERVEVYFNKYSLILLCVIIAFFGAFKNHSNFIYFQF